MAFTVTTGNPGSPAVIGEKSAATIYAKALNLGGRATSTPGAATDGTADEFVLGLEQKGFIRDFLNRNNPLSAYTQMIDIAETGAGSITIKWDGASNPWLKKEKLGSGEAKGVDMRMEAILWNSPVFQSEGIDAYSLKKGALNTLAYRMEKLMVKYTQDSIKRGFKAMEDAGTAVAAGVAFGSVDGSQANAQKMVYAITKQATAMVKELEVSPSDLVITVLPEVFDHIAMAGFLGDRVTQTFAGGQYSVATIGGYRIQSGEMFLSAEFTLAASKNFAIIATRNSVVSKIDIIAANTGKINLSNDIGTYIEVADINVVPQYAKENKFIKVLTFDTPRK